MRAYTYEVILNCVISSTCWFAYCVKYNRNQNTKNSNQFCSLFSYFFSYLFFFLIQNWGHKEDILCVAQCPPNLLATSSYDGEIIVWNMVSGHIDHRFYIPMTTAASAHSQSKFTNQKKTVEYNSHIAMNNSL